MPLVTVDEANDHLRLELEIDDDASPPAFVDPRLANLVAKIAAAEASILNYLKVPAATDVEVLIAGDEDTSPVIAPYWAARDLVLVRAATLLMLEALYDAAPGREVTDYMQNLPGGSKGAIALLLMRLRDPALA